MKKTILLTAALLIASATVFTACSSSDDNIISENQQPASTTGKYTMTVQASKGDGATTRALSLSGKTLSAAWAAGEQVTVYNNTKSAALGGHLEAKSSGTNTTLTGELTGTVENGDELTLKFLSPTYGTQDGTLTGSNTSIDKVCDYAEASVTVSSVAGGNITTTAATFENKQAIVKFTLKDKGNSDAAISATKLVVNDGTNSYTVTPTPATSELYVALPDISSKTLTLTATDGTYHYAYEKSGVTFANGQYYEITVKMTKVAGLLGGVFSVSDTKKVKFSKGNLRYASSKWSFFDNQYGYYPSYSTDAWDKFGWSTSATTYGKNTSQSSSTYSGDFVDWGATMGAGWFTLSKDEWTYLFNTRSAISTVGGTANGRYAKAKVNNVPGVILFPDTYTRPDGVADPTNVNSTGSAYTSNTYSSADWTKMESAGCVFLPAAGERGGSSVYDDGSYGNYWSSTDNDAGSAYYVYFSSGSLDAGKSYNRYAGFSVRLVLQVE